MPARLTAMEIEKQEFRRKMRGFDPEDVRLYLRSVAEEVERLNLENGKLLEASGQLRTHVDDLRSREKALQETLLVAQRMAEEMKERARKEGEYILREARYQAERMLKEAQDQLLQIESEISRSRLERESFESRLRSVIDQHLSLLDLRREGRGELDGLRVVPYPQDSEAG
jgi:cell division initiation protein